MLFASTPRRAIAAAIALVSAIAHLPDARAGEPSTPAEAIAEAARLDREADRLYRADRLDEALEMVKREVALTVKVLGPKDPHTAGARASLGGILVARGEYVEAEPPLREAIDVLEHAPGADDHDLASAINNLAVLDMEKGEVKASRPLFERAVAIMEASKTPDPETLASYYGALAQTLDLLGDSPAAIGLVDKAIAIHERAGAERSLVVDLLRKGDVLRRSAGHGTEDVYRRAFELAEKALGPDHHLTAEARRRWGRLFWGAAAWASRGEGFYKDANDSLVKTLGPMHPEIADVLCDWAVLKQLEGDLPGALDLRRRADVIDEHHLSLLLAAGSEDDQRAFSAKLFRRAEDAVELSLTLGGGSKESIRFALAMILRRKGRVLDAITDQRAALRRLSRPEDRRVLADLEAARAELAGAVIRGPGQDRAGYPARIAELEAREKEAEQRAGAASAAYRASSSPIAIEAIAKAIPEGSALVEIIRLAPTDIHALVDRSLSPVYIAFLLERDGRVLQLHMGDATTIDHLSHALRASLSAPDRRDVLDLGSRLYNATIARFDADLRKYKSLVIAPDGELNLVPFAALADESGDFLVRRFTFTYLSSGRDLLRLADRTPSAGGPVILANPKYDAGAPAGGAPKPGSRGLSADDLSRMRFPPLPGTQAEADAIGPLLPGATVLTGAQATKAALRALHGPSVLHVATHGFALPNASDDAEAGKGRRGLELVVEPRARKAHVQLDARYRSGIALAGANTRSAGGDGVLTALEASGLDLGGTRLVVLSACETGVGDVQRGEGVYSLRRAFVEAGAETQVMSLWQVDDRATTTLMSGYYKRLFRDGLGRSEALREQQIAMLGEASTAHPFYWASFTVSGDPSPIAGPGASAPIVAPSARGCACDVGERGGEAPIALLAAVAAILARRRRGEVALQR
jgi:MYXO-CTERM domain-containing protein